MALIRQNAALRVAQDAIVLDLGDLARQGDAVRAAARKEAEAILTRAAAERERLVAGGREEGLAQGLAEGRAKGEKLGRAAGEEKALAEHKATLATLEAAWNGALDAFEKERSALIEEAGRETVRLAAMIAERVVKRVVAMDGSVVRGQLEAALQLVTRPTRLVVTVNPADEELVRRALPVLAARLAQARDVEVRTDESVSRGGVIARHAGGGWIDAGVESQLDRIVDALLPGGRGEAQAADDATGGAS